MPPRDKIRPWVNMRCSEPDCEFESAAEWAWIAHEQDTGHKMDWPTPKVIRPWPA